MAYIKAQESTANVPSTRAVRDVTPGLAYLNSELAPLTIVTKKSATKSAENFKFEWHEKDMLISRFSAVNNGGGYNTTATSVVVDDGTKFQAGDVVAVLRTGEKMRVTSVSTNTLTVVRAVDGDGTTGSAINDNDDLLILGNASAEGASVKTPHTEDEDNVYNYTQIIRNSFGATETELATKQYTGDDRARQTKEKFFEHMVDIERTGLFGERNRFTTGVGSTNNPVNFTGGLLYYLTSNNTNVSGTVTEAEVETFCQSVFEATGGSNTRVLLASPLWVSIIDQLAMGRLQTVPSDKTFGIAVKEWATAHGTLLITKHRLLANGGTTGDGYGGYAIAADMSKIKFRPLRNTKLLKDRHSPGDDAYTDEYLTEAGWEVQLPGAHGVLTGATG